MAVSVLHDVDRCEFVVPLDAKRATLSYAHAGDRVLDFRSTFVPVEYRRRGTGDALVCHALEYAKENGYRVIPTCWFVREVMALHPEYRTMDTG
jgi:predicted GNAT family acetyltransferase